MKQTWSKKLKWTQEAILIEAAKHNTIKEFRGASPGAYQAAQRKGYMPLVHEVLPSSFREINPELAFGVAKKYNSRGELQKNDGTVYNYLLRESLLNKACKHMKPSKTGKKWDKVTCAEAARKCGSRSELWKNFPAAAHVASTGGYLDEICGHMGFSGNNVYRYVYELRSKNNKDCYIGISYDPEKRLDQHKRKDDCGGHSIAVRPHRLIVSKRMHVSRCARLEKLLIKRRRSQGFNVLNQATGGCLGGNKIKWTTEAVREFAKGFDRVVDFMRANSRAYDVARREDMLDELFPNRIKTRPAA